MSTFRRCKQVLLLTMLIVGIGSAADVEAHGGSSGPVGRQLIEKEEGGYLLRIETDPNQFIQGNDVLIEAMLIADPESRKWAFADYDTVGFTVNKGKDVVTERKMRRVAPGSALFLHSFDVPGMYDVTVAFVKNGTVIAEETFSVAISSTWPVGRWVGSAVMYIEYTMVIVLFAIAALALLGKETLLPAARP